MRRRLLADIPVMGPAVSRTGQERRRNDLDDVQVELTELLFNKVVLQILLGGASLAGFTMVVAGRHRDPTLWHISFAMAAICALRVGIVCMFNHRDRILPGPLTVRSARLWETWFGALTIAHAATMAFCTFRYFIHYDVTSKLVCTMGTFAFCNGIGARFALRAWMSNLAAFVMLAALAWGLLHLPDGLARSTVLILVFYFYTYVHTVSTKLETLVEQFRSRSRLRTLAEQDMLTGLANRRSFQCRLAALCEEEASFALLLIDLDRFKAVNDTLGHASGDLLLQRASERMASTLRPTDLLARLGGDEFAILQTPMGTRADAEGLAQRVNLLIGEPFEIDGERVSIGASIGVQLSTRAGGNPEDVVRSADEALYRVKEAGRGSFSFA